MLTLFLLRHAKSSWNDETLDDFARPLNARGNRSAPAIGQFMAEKSYSPSLILCSGARRTRETLGHIIPFLSGNQEVRIEDTLYRAFDGPALLQRLHTVDRRFSSLMLIGHNPSIQDLFSATANDGEAETIERLKTKYPTAALAVLKFDVASWADIGINGGTVLDTALPRDLLAS